MSPRCLNHKMLVVDGKGYVLCTQPVCYGCSLINTEIKTTHTLRSCLCNRSGILNLLLRALAEDELGRVSPFLCCTRAWTKQSAGQQVWVRGSAENMDILLQACFFFSRSFSCRVRVLFLVCPRLSLSSLCLCLSHSPLSSPLSPPQTPRPAEAYNMRLGWPGTLCRSS